MYLKERFNEGPRLQCKQKDESEKKRKKKHNVLTSEERKAVWHRQTKRLEDRSSRYLRLIHYGERTSTSTLALSYPLLRPSRYVRTYYYCILSVPRSNISTYHPPLMLLKQHPALYNLTDIFAEKRGDRKFPCLYEAFSRYKEVLYLVSLQFTPHCTMNEL